MSKVTMLQKTNLAWLLVIVGLAHAQADELCDGRQFDTIFSTPQSEVYIFKGSQSWKLTAAPEGSGFNIAEGYPTDIQRHWQELPTDITASFTNYNTGLTYFFKGQNVWLYSGNTLQPGFPRTITQEFPGIPDNFDLAFMCSGGYYFFQGDKFWGFNLAKRSAFGPYSINGLWTGLPNDMNAAVQLPAGGFTYFFKDGQYYKFKVSTLSIVELLLRYGAKTESKNMFLRERFAVDVVLTFFYSHHTKKEAFTSGPTVMKYKRCLRLLLRAIPQVRFPIPSHSQFSPFSRDVEIPEKEAFFAYAVASGLVPASRAGRTPPELKHQCRGKIRQILYDNWQLPRGIAQLELPRCLEVYLDLKQD